MKALPHHPPRFPLTRAAEVRRNLLAGALLLALLVAAAAFRPTPAPSEHQCAGAYCLSFHYE